MTVNLNEWAIKHSIPLTALHDLKYQMGLFTMETMPVGNPKSEGAVTTAVRLEAADKGILLWRNNVGAMQDETGRVVRYGLANESQRMNKSVKSSDLVGIKPNGQFVCREMKAHGWQYTGTPRELAQKKFIDLVLSKGGDASFATGVGTL